MTHYIKAIIMGHNLTETYPPIQQLSAVINPQASVELGSTPVEVTFQIKDHEPFGLNRLWMAYVFYNQDELKCQFTSSCLSQEDIMMDSNGPFKYYNGKTFSNTIDKNLVLTLYWSLIVSSIFWILGLPITLALYLFLNGYMLILLIFNITPAFLSTTTYFDPAQSALYSPLNWFLEMFLFWVGGTWLISTTLICMSLLMPIIGPILGSFLVLLVEPLLTWW